jgi:hypothetical protein
MAYRSDLSSRDVHSRPLGPSSNRPSRDSIAGEMLDHCAKFMSSQEQGVKPDG